MTRRLNLFKGDFSEMKSADGYRLNIRRIQDFARVTEGFKADALRILARRYGKEVAARAVLLHDLHAVGVGDNHASSVIRVACEDIRKRYPAGPNGLPHAELNCLINYIFFESAVLAVYRHGAGVYRKSFESRREVIRWAWSAGVEKPSSLSVKNWKERERVWTEVLKQPALAPGLSFRLVDTTLPTIGWGAIRRYIPSNEDRVVSLLKTADGGQKELRAALAPVLARGMTKEVLLGIPRKPSVKPKVEKTRKVTARPKKSASNGNGNPDEFEKADQIDHADVIKASDGRIFLAVPYVGLDKEARVFIKVSDGVMSIDQNSISYGYVSKIPRPALDILAGTKTVTVVEVGKSGGKKLLRAKHVAIVRNIRFTAQPIEVPSAYRTKGINSGEIEEWEAR